MRTRPIRLGGWLRLWILLAALYGFVVLTVGYIEQPSADHIRASWISDASQVIAERLSKVEGKDVSTWQVREVLEKDASPQEVVAELEKMANAPNATQAKFSSDVSRVNARYRSRLEGLSAERKGHWVVALAWWVGPMFASLLVGYSIRWVARGFRRE